MSPENRPADGDYCPDDNRRRGNPDERPKVLAIKPHCTVNQIACAKRRKINITEIRYVHRLIL